MTYTTVITAGAIRNRNVMKSLKSNPPDFFGGSAGQAYNGGVDVGVGGSVGDVNPPGAAAVGRVVRV